MKNHQYINGKLLQLNKKFNQLKEHQRVQIAEWLYEAYKEIRMERKQTTNKEADAHIIEIVMKKLSDCEIWIPECEVIMYYKAKKSGFSKRFETETRA